MNDFVVMRRKPENVGGYVNIAEAGSRRQAEKIAAARDDYGRKNGDRVRLHNVVVWTRRQYEERYDDAIMPYY